MDKDPRSNLSPSDYEFMHAGFAEVACSHGKPPFEHLCMSPAGLLIPVALESNLGGAEEVDEKIQQGVWGAVDRHNELFRKPFLLLRPAWVGDLVHRWRGNRSPIMVNRLMKERSRTKIGKGAEAMA
jgi:hypothetical protein